MVRLLPLIFLFLASCATKQTHRFGSEPDYGVTNADASSYGTDHFTVQKLMPKRAPAAVGFYNKQCFATGQASFVSKTSYYCDYR